METLDYSKNCKKCQHEFRADYHARTYVPGSSPKRVRTPEERLARRKKDKLRYHINKNPYSTAAGNHNARARRAGIKGRVTAAELQALRESQGNCCYYCARELTEARNPQADHIIPITRLELNPTGDISNFMWACGRCNQFKNNKTNEEWTPRWYEIPELLLAEEELERLAAGD